MISIKNSQRKIKLNLKQIEDDAKKIIDLLKYSDFDLGILFTTNKKIREYNKTYRNIDKATDVLSFPFHTELKAGERIKPKSSDEKNLGDLIFAPEYIATKSLELKLPFEQHLRALLVHGICHLLGYDHIYDDDYKKMRRKELHLLKHLS